MSRCAVESAPVVQSEELVQSNGPSEHGQSSTDEALEIVVSKRPRRKRQSITDPSSKKRSTAGTSHIRVTHPCSLIHCVGSDYCSTEKYTCNRDSEQLKSVPSLHPAYSRWPILRGKQGLRTHVYQTDAVVMQSYFDQAKEVARLLNIKLTQRTWDGQRIWMCGFPLPHLDKYLKILVQGQKRFVAMCEEFPRNPQLGAKGGFDRRVVRIVTPGTLIDEPFLNPYENNYLLAISQPASGQTLPSVHVGLAWIDVSTGEFFTKTTPMEGLRDELVRISPREVVLCERLDADSEGHIKSVLEEEGLFISLCSIPVPTDVSALASLPESADDVISHLETETRETSVVTESEARAISLLTTFMQANLLEHMPMLASPSRETSSGRMQIDSHTIRALEIRAGLSDGGATGSLLSVVKRTVTSGGTRLLARWLCMYGSTALRDGRGVD